MGLEEGKKRQETDGRTNNLPSIQPGIACGGRKKSGLRDGDRVQYKINRSASQPLVPAGRKEAQNPRRGVVTGTPAWTHTKDTKHTHARTRANTHTHKHTRAQDTQAPHFFLPADGLALGSGSDKTTQRAIPPARQGHPPYARDQSVSPSGHLADARAEREPLVQPIHRRVYGRFFGGVAFCWRFW